MSGRTSQAKPEEDSKAASVQNQPQVEESKPVDATSLLTAWRDFAHNLPREETAMANRLKDIEPVLLNEWQFEVVANNEIVEKELKAMVPRILQSIRTNLRNGKLEMTVRMRKQEDRQRAYNRREQFALMCENSNALLRLKEVFDLELD